MALNPYASPFVPSYHGQTLPSCSLLPPTSTGVPYYTFVYPPSAYILPKHYASGLEVYSAHHCFFSRWPSAPYSSHELTSSPDAGVKTVRGRFFPSSSNEVVAKSGLQFHLRRWAPKLRYLMKRRDDEKISAGDYEFKEDTDGVTGDDGRTTVMIKNVPNKYTKELLLSLLDKHCREENETMLKQEADDGGDAKRQSALSAFDFFYLPMDFGTGNNLGYAFVNFTTAAASRRFHRALHNCKWLIYGSRKVCEVTYARIQGLEALKNHFQKSIFQCNSEDLLPCVFLPPRNGDFAAESRFVGRWAPRRLPPRCRG